jgi:hypothetical protein
MSGNYDNTNRGVLFKNNKATTEKHPSHTGEIDVNGEKFKLAAWVKTSAKGTKFFSLSIEPMQEQHAPASPRAPRSAAPATQTTPRTPSRQSTPPNDDLNDEIPF